MRIERLAKDEICPVITNIVGITSSQSSAAIQTSGAWNRRRYDLLQESEREA